MNPITHPVLIISRKALQAAQERTAVFRYLASLTRSGWHLLLTASEPGQWFPTRSSGDNVLTTQAHLQRLIQEHGGDIDGVYYVPKSGFTQDRNREGALGDIVVRYGNNPQNAHLISDSEPFLTVAGKLGINLLALPKGPEGPVLMERHLKMLVEQAGQ